MGLLKHLFNIIIFSTFWSSKSICGFRYQNFVCTFLPCMLRDENMKVLKKSKSVPLQARKDPEGSRKLRFPDFITTAQDGGKVVSLTHRPPLPPGNTPGTHFC